MKAFSTPFPVTLPGSPSQDGQDSTEFQLEREWSEDPSVMVTEIGSAEISSTEISPTVMTIAMVGESETPAWDPAEALARLAQLAATDELVVVYGSDQDEFGSSAQPLLAGLHNLLPRHTVVVMYVVPENGPLARESALLDELLDLGSLPVVVAPARAVSAVALELCDRLEADRLLSVSSNQVEGVGDHVVSCTGSIYPRHAA